MATVSLKNIIGKKNEITADILSIIRALDIAIWIEDANGKVLMGDQKEITGSSFPVIIDNETLGWVKGNEKGMIISNLLAHLVQKETEKKKLGTEVLSLYQEINVIFNFSEKLAQTIEPEAIARVTLEQTMHSIPAHSGVLTLWDEANRELQIPAASGGSLFNDEKIRNSPGILLKIGLNGQSEIINDLSVLKEKEIRIKVLGLIIY